MNEPIEYSQDEISIHDLIKLLLSGKKIIIAVTVFAMIISAVFGYVILDNEYEAKTTINANPITITSTQSTDKDATAAAANTVVQELTGFPSLTLATYLQQIVSKNVLSDAIAVLNLTDSSGKLISDAALKGMITVTNPPNTNMIEMTVKHNDPDKAAAIANAVSASFIQYVNTLYQQATQQAVAKIANQLTIEEQNLAEKSKAVVNYLQDHENIDVLKGEIDSLVAQINQNQAELNRISTEISIDQATIKTLVNLYPEVKNTILSDLQLDVSVQTSDATSSQATDSQKNPADQTVIQFTAPNDQLTNSLVRIELNDLQNRMIHNINSQEVLSKTILTMQSDLKSKKSTLTEQEYQYNSLATDLDLAKATYNAYQQRHKEVLLASAADLGGSNIVVTSAASVPDKPVSPNRMQILLIGTLLGLMAGAAFVLFKHYWQAETKG